MPVGVPKVPFDDFEEEDDDDASWVDLYNRLYRERAIFYGHNLDNALANHIMGLLVYLNIEDPLADVFMFINSQGGSLVSGVAVHDMMQAVSPHVQTICMGLAASTASFILSSGEITKRSAFPHARVMMHQPVAEIFEKLTTEDSILDMKELLRMYYCIIWNYHLRTHQCPLIIYDQMQRDDFMSPKDAQSLGIIDDILEKEKGFYLKS